jgi:hypothetical protein
MASSCNVAMEVGSAGLGECESNPGVSLSRHLPTVCPGYRDHAYTSRRGPPWFSLSSSAPRSTPSSQAGARFEEAAPWSFALPELVLLSVEDRLGSGSRFGGPSAGTLLMERPCANDRSGPLLTDGRSQTAKSGFVDDTEPAISGCISIVGQRVASRSGHAPKRPPGFAQIPRRCPTSEAARGRYRRDQSSQSR